MAAGVDAGGDAQHDACGFAQAMGDARDACGFVRGVDHNLREALADGEFDFLVRLVVAVKHETTPGNTRSERDAHLAHRASVDQHAGVRHQSQHFLGHERLGGEAHVGCGVGERGGGRMNEVMRAGIDVIGVHHVQRRAELVEQGLRAAAVESQGAVTVD